MDKEWKLGEDLSTCDNLLDGVTFDELILTVHCNCRCIDSFAVRAELNRILEIKKLDMMILLESNMDAIIDEARKGREA